MSEASGVFEITMNAPRKNALGSEMMAWLRARLVEAAGRPVLLTGSGDAFSAGLDLREVAALDEASAPPFLAALETTMCALYQYPGPTVAHVNGHAIAGGCVLALCCDHRVADASTRARIGLNEVALGVRFPPRIFEIVRRRVPAPRVEEVLLGAGLYRVADAASAGLIDVAAEDAGALARARVAALAALPRDAYAAHKADLRGRVEQDLVPDAAEARWMAENARVWTSPEVKAKVLAVLSR